MQQALVQPKKSQLKKNGKKLKIGNKGKMGGSWEGKIICRLGASAGGGATKKSWGKIPTLFREAKKCS